MSAGAAARGILIVFARRPEAGAAKTRLCPPFTPEQAADLYACMLDDALEVSAGACARLGLALGLAVHPPEATPEMGRRAPAGTRLFPQRGRDLGERMEAAARDAAGAGFAPLLLRGSDSPLLGEEALRAALSALGRADVVLRPGPDGGYDLVALRRPAAGLFTHPMGDAEVLRATRARAEGQGLRVAQLPPGFDVDTAEDLRRLAAARRAGRADGCPRTLAWLDAADAWPDGDAGRGAPARLSAREG